MIDVDFEKRLLSYNKLNVEKYLKDLKLIGSLSRLFSENEIPFLHYRLAENLYCENFDAENLSRDDNSVDAKLNFYGIGIKTFIENNKKTFQKISEFNKQLSVYKNLNGIEKIKKISELRNKRLSFTKNVYGLTELIYHCIIRNKKGFFLFEEIMNSIETKNIKIISESLSNCVFSDGIETYKFDFSKSTLYKQFLTNNYFAFIDVEILNNPIVSLRNFLISKSEKPINFFESIVVPLFSFSKDGNKVVYEKSGLNQWNAGGRKRDYNEVYIPFNSTLREMHENFFPPRDEPFEVILPNGNKMIMKLCQDNCKALMSNPNKDLGKWLLRDVLKIPYGQTISYKDLLEIGIDSVSFKKIENKKYLLNFKKIGEFEKSLNREN